MNDEDFLKKVGDNIVKIRTEKGLKQIDLAICLNMEDSSLRRIEKGRTNTSILMLRKIAFELNVSVKDLLEL
jgi:putative transcriptional regulator